MHKTGNVKEAINYYYTRGAGYRDGLFNVSKEFPGFQANFGTHLVECSDRVLEVLSRAVNNPRSKDDVLGILVELLHLGIIKGNAIGRGDKEHRFQIVVTGMGVDKVYTLRAVCGACDGYSPVLNFSLADE